MIENNFSSVFTTSTPIIGMIHCAGDSLRDRVRRAIDELRVFGEEEINAALVENYHGDEECARKVLEAYSRIQTPVIVGVNLLAGPQSYRSLEIAAKCGARFVQIDSITCNYLMRDPLDAEEYIKLREQYPHICVLGGVWPKYYSQVPGSVLENDLAQGISHCDAIVVTGSGTGVETPSEKIRMFRETIKDYPLIVGAGLNSQNAYEQLAIANGAIVGSSLKVGGQTQNPLDVGRIRELMAVVKQVREEKSLPVL